MKRIDGSTVELTDQEQRFVLLYDAKLDQGAGCTDAFLAAWRELGDFGWLPSAEFCAWEIGVRDAGPSEPDDYVQDTLYTIHCEQATCPDHGPVRVLLAEQHPSMAGGTDSVEGWSCQCLVYSTPYGGSRQREDGTWADVTEEM